MANNPARFIDKNGNLYSGNDSFASSLLSALGSLRGHNREKELLNYLAGISGNVIVRNVRQNTAESNIATPDGKWITRKKNDKNKVYSLHEVDVQCISKGKEHKLYEFGNKVSITRTGTV